MSKQNPVTGTHPDLFDEGETPIWVPASELTRKQLLSLPRSAYRDDEWSELDADIREHIYATDPDSIERISEFSEPFIEAFKYVGSVHEPDYHRGYFDTYLSQTPDDLASVAPQADVDEIVDHYANAGYTREQVIAALNVALLDIDNFDVKLEGQSYYGHPGSIWYTDINNEYAQFEAGRVKVIYDDMHDDEIERAIKKINEETDDAWYGLSLDSIKKTMRTKFGSFDTTFDTGMAVVAYPLWKQIEDDVGAELSDQEPDEEEVEVPEEKRIFHRFSDGAFVLDLQASELADEGRAMGSCVNKPEYGYARTIRLGETKILSFRTPSGRPKFTFEVLLAAPPRSSQAFAVAEIEQIKGKANRLPGFDMGHAGWRRGKPWSDQKMKVEEVKKILEVVRKMGVDPNDVQDLGPALARMGEYVSNPAHGRGANDRDVHCGFCCKPAR